MTYPSDTYGALQIPVQAPPAPGTEISDPAVTIVVQYLKACLIKYASAAWGTVAKTVVTPAGTVKHPVVATSNGHNPVEESFTDIQLPALYLWRTKGERPFWLTEDWRITTDTWTLLYIFREATQDGRRIRQSFINAIVKIVDAMIEQERDPAYVASWDTDPLARDTAAVPDAIKTSIASSISAQTYSGAALNGATGGNAFVSPQVPTVTATGTGGVGTVEFTGIGSDGQPRISRVVMTGVGTFVGDFELSQVTQIDVPDQADTGATFTFGLNGFTGLGTNVLVLGNLLDIEVASWTERIWTLPMNDVSGANRSYDALEISFTVQERWTRDGTTIVPLDPNDTLYAQFPTDGSDNSSVREEALYPT